MICDDVLSIILLYCGEREILFFYKKFPYILGNIKFHMKDNIKNIDEKYYKYVKILYLDMFTKNKDIKKFTGTEILVCEWNYYVNNKGLENMKMLKQLYCGNNKKINNDCIKYLPNLKILHKGLNYNFSKSILKKYKYNPLIAYI